MPLVNFTCPDGVDISIEDCFEKCRMAQRCATLPTLLATSRDRAWDGTPHVTSLLNGTMEEWLKVTKPYSTSPDRMAFALLGSSHHGQLEQLADELEHPAEVNFKREGHIQGTADYLEPLEDGTFRLWDYKTWGSYKMASAIGLINLGDKRAPRWIIDPSKADIRDTALQLNGYRVEFEKNGIPISDLKVQATVRDGNTAIAKSRGVDKNIYVVDVPMLDNKMVELFFATKRDMIVAAINGELEPDICSPDERWNNTKCKSYCEVAMHCPHGRLVQSGMIN